MRAVNKLIPGALRRDLKRLILLPRRIDAHTRSLPDFLIIGAQRCGTSSLYSYMVQHPAIYTATYKEVHYFDWYYGRGMSWYRAQFPRLAKKGTRGRTGEASPSYLYSADVPARIHELLPDIKLIAILRDPVKRAISHYNYECKMGREDLSLEKAIESEEQQDSGTDIFLKKDGEYSKNKEKNRSYLKRGRYYEQLMRYADLFSSDQILLLNSEELFSDPRQTLKGVFNFIEVDTDFFPRDVEKKNSAGPGKAVSPEVLRNLREYYKEPNLALYDYLQKDMCWL